MRAIKGPTKKALPDFKWGKLGQIVAALGIYVAIMEYCRFLNFFCAVSSFCNVNVWRKKNKGNYSCCRNIISCYIFSVYRSFYVVLPGIPGIELKERSCGRWILM